MRSVGEVDTPGPGQEVMCVRVARSLCSDGKRARWKGIEGWKDDAFSVSRGQGGEATRGIFRAHVSADIICFPRNSPSLFIGPHSTQRPSAQLTPIRRLFSFYFFFFINARLWNRLVFLFYYYLFFRNFNNKWPSFVPHVFWHLFLAQHL